ncbi:MAG TPA: ABC transporter permease subunit [Polyangiaceae bacterium]|jgi:ABC-type dipeptide/oligopeptide/nickel transport system permease component
MLRYALRRVLWAIPTLLATSLVLFFVTTLAPDPARDTGDATLAEARRTRFVDLPRFVNTRPKDVVSRATAAVKEVASGGADQGADEGRGARELRRLGGAALPYVLPLLEALPPEERGRVAVALAPVASRMGLGGAADLRAPQTAALFWSRFWDDRALDFTRTAVARAVSRLIEHGTDLRETDLVSLDTYALPEVIHAMTTTTDHVALERLTRIARHATERGPLLAADSDATQVRRAVADWQEWWFVHATDYVELDGADRAVAVLTETRYGKWLRRAASGELGVSAIDGEPILDKLRERAPVTLLVCALAMMLSWALAIPLGAIGAWRQGRAFDWVSGGVLFLLYATPTFAVAEVLRRLAGGSAVGEGRVWLAVTALALGSMATLSRWQRSAMLDVVRQDFVRTARAKGLPAWRVAVVHALRNALMPTVTLAGLHLPVLLGGAFVVEEVFGLPGIGFETIRAIEAHDAAWLMAVILASAVAVTMGLVASDVAYGALDPRVREVLSRRQERRAA